MVMCDAVSVMVCYGRGRRRDILICAAVNFRFVTGWGRRREMVMCAAVSVMVFYRLGETEGNGNVCCS